ncbi:MAG: hypothetical protein AB8B44_01055, partial [Prochlorococcus sp.]
LLHIRGWHSSENYIILTLLQYDQVFAGAGVCHYRMLEISNQSCQFSHQLKLLVAQMSVYWAGTLYVPLNI